MLLKSNLIIFYQTKNDSIHDKNHLLSFFVTKSWFHIRIHGRKTKCENGPFGLFFVRIQGMTFHSEPILFMNMPFQHQILISANFFSNAVNILFIYQS